MIEFNNVTKIYDGSSTRQEALSDISLKIEDGEFVYIIGPNGSGKSTLVKLLNCEEKITAGTIRFDDYELSRIRRREIPYLRRRIGMVFQDFRLIENMTVYENVAFALRVTGRSNREIRRKVPRVLELMGLLNKVHCRPDELSGGEQQKVGIARALVGSPKVLIADEPTGNVDPEMSHELLDLLGYINEEAHTTVLLVTHQRDFIRRMPRRVIMLDNGHIAFDEDLSMAQYAPASPDGEEADAADGATPPPDWQPESTVPLDSGFVPSDYRAGEEE